MLNNREQDKLLPLRKFVKEGQYSQAYLSILVNRKKLKAKKIGRNYFTTEAWFKEYLERHARDNKKDEKTVEINSVTIKSEEITGKLKAGFFVNKKIRIFAQAMAVFVILLLINYIFNVALHNLFPEKENGQVLGVSEEATGTIGSVISIKP